MLATVEFDWEMTVWQCMHSAAILTAVQKYGSISRLMMTAAAADTKKSRRQEICSVRVDKILH